MAYSTIVKPSDYFNTKLYTGNGGTQAVTGVGFQPDWVWLKKRNGTAPHNVFDAVRGVTKTIYTNLSEAEYTEATALTAFGTDGFTLGAYGDTNSNSATFASWNWKAGTGQGSSNTDGSINTTYTSVNTTAGFSISSFTGTGANATFGHGLGAVPKMYILKRYDASNNWRVYHESLGNGKYITLETTEAAQTSSGFTNNTSPTSSLISLGNLGSANPSGGSVICYAFAEKKGYSKFGSYTANGNADGTFVYTGFKPAMIIIKRSSSTEDWEIIDNKRLGYNVANYDLRPNSTMAEANYTPMDLLSNGFKLRSTNASINGSGTFIYMAFAEEPLVANSGTDGVPATAR